MSDALGFGLSSGGSSCILKYAIHSVNSLLLIRSNISPTGMPNRSASEK
jgi:hypothetical protein